MALQVFLIFSDEKVPLKASVVFTSQMKTSPQSVFIFEIRF